LKPPSAIKLHTFGMICLYDLFDLHDDGICGFVSDQLSSSEKYILLRHDCKRYFGDFHVASVNVIFSNMFWGVVAVLCIHIV